MTPAWDFWDREAGRGLVLKGADTPNVDAAVDGTGLWNTSNLAKLRPKIGMPHPYPGFPKALTGNN
jgi:hypothetical protein